MAIRGTHLRLLLLGLASALAGCGEYPCTWDISESTLRDRDAVIPTGPGVSLQCAGTPLEAPQQLGAFYGGTAGAYSLPGFFGDLFVRIRGGRVTTDLRFAGDLRDGTYQLEGKLEPPPVPPPFQPSGGLVSGKIAFSRSRDVPFIDLKDPDARVYECTIDVEFDLVITDLTGTPVGMPELGCVLTTGPQQAHLVQKGPVKMCQRGVFRGGH